MEFDEVLRNDRTTIPIVYFMVHSNGRPLAARNEIAFSNYYIFFWYVFIKNASGDFDENFTSNSLQNL